MPDIADMVIGDFIPLSSILKIRASEDGRAFRVWFHQNCRGDPIATGRAFADVLKSVPLVRSAPVKALRFLVTTAIGAAAGPVAKGLAKAVDSFFVDRLLRGGDPKIFLQKLSKLPGRL